MRELNNEWMLAAKDCHKQVARDDSFSAGRAATQGREPSETQGLYGKKPGESRAGKAVR
ncbi:MAG: hypothetical protein AAF456_06755 [Planctomycetota bacterium]